MARQPELKAATARSRDLLARGRTRVGIERQDAWDRFVASDPGLTRLRLGVRAAASVGTTIVVQLLVAQALGVVGPTRVLHLLLGSLIAMNMSTIIKEPRRRDILGTAAYTPFAAALGASLATVLAPIHLLAISAFVIVSAGAVWVRRHGPRWFTNGFITWQAYFFTLYLHPPISTLPGMLLATVVSTTWVTLLLITVLYDDPAAKLRRTVTALRARARSVVAHSLDVLRDAADTELVLPLRRQLVKLSEGALLFDAQLSGYAADSGVSATRMRRWIIEIEISSEEIANASVELRDRFADCPADTRAAVIEMLEALGWGHVDAARSKVATLRREQHADLSAVRRLTNAAEELLNGVEEWTSGRLTEGEDETSPGFETVVELVSGNLPGAAQLAADALPGRPHGSRWHPGTWSLSTRQSVQAGAAAALAIAIGEAISPQRFYWAVIAAFVSFTGTTTSGETVRKSFARIGGTMAGLVAAVGLAQVTGGHPLIDVLVLLTCIFLAFYLQALSYAAMIFFITLMLGELYGVLRTFSDSLLVLRLAETAAGALAGVVVALVVLPTSARSTLIASRRALLERMSELVAACAARLRGEPVTADLLADAVRLDAAARQVVRNSDSMLRLRILDPDHSGRRHRVAVLGVAATHARSLVPAVLAAPSRSSPNLAAVCDVLAGEAHRIAAIPDLRDQSEASAVADVAASVNALLDGAEDAPVVLSRRLQRLADSLSLLTPRGRA